MMQKYFATLYSSPCDNLAYEIVVFVTQVWSNFFFAIVRESSDSQTITQLLQLHVQSCTCSYLLE